MTAMMSMTQKPKKLRMARLTLLLTAAALVIWLAPASAAVNAATDNNGVIRGTVTSVNGPEAGVWVIAETNDLETVFRKIVVTGDDGRYVLPELPTASYDIWVRGYGLVDSTPVSGSPDQELDLTAAGSSGSLPGQLLVVDYRPSGTA